ncbi:flavodoxin family protein [Solitalea lacus]|uniref:flavodoxin family protein n=1 Tax=Solitalea lacus TaxID=2911172 RepID=UPI001EDBE1D6|nr:NAD(P)H-dependent oxidoreductase [Solitalea lacus]UKJ08754.1 NAD(P)H-dependent oxidoreductase [Solitalea lacus]
MKKLIILGSSRKNGNTQKAVDILNSLSGFDILDLGDFNISQYDYEHKNNKDDYLKLMHRIIDNYDTLVFATPVYWYSMSGVMKVFFDRFTDLLDNEKELGRKLRNKNMAVLSSSIGDHLGENFWLPFIETAKYLGMNYIGNVHTITDQDPTEELMKFVDLINKKSIVTNEAV